MPGNDPVMDMDRGSGSGGASRGSLCPAGAVLEGQLIVGDLEIAHEKVRVYAKAASAPHHNGIVLVCVHGDHAVGKTDGRAVGLPVGPQKFVAGAEGYKGVVINGDRPSAAIVGVTMTVIVGRSTYMDGKPTVSGGVPTTVQLGGDIYGLKAAGGVILNICHGGGYGKVRQGSRPGQGHQRHQAQGEGQAQQERKQGAVCSVCIFHKGVPLFCPGGLEYPVDYDNNLTQLLDNGKRVSPNVIFLYRNVWALPGAS